MHSINQTKLKQIETKTAESLKVSNSDVLDHWSMEFRIKIVFNF